MHRCGFTWIRFNGEIVQCVLENGHNIRHINGFAWVRVGSELGVKGYWKNYE